jgi:ATP-dependent Clp protease ATP-binding subunit ClpA
MMFERFTSEARNVVVGAQEQARALEHRFIGTEHLLLSMLANDDTAARLLRERGVTVESARAMIERYVGGVPPRLTPSDAEALRAIGIDIDEVRRRLEENFGPNPLAAPPQEPVRRRFGLRRTRRQPDGGQRDGGQRGGGQCGGPGITGHIPFSPRAKKVLELSLREALRLKHRSIGTEHVLLGLIREGQGLGALVLAEAKVDLAELRRTVENSFRDAA